ncbi:MAG: hypothetical protein B6D37_00035 [Sphingobacteriales bacterium UTBCD1]|jgi:hypothetical protein|nr:MAG: hypothetical protein B6D37_00035 [Sphingobacteriales bacterium UTBCD1]
MRTKKYILPHQSADRLVWLFSSSWKQENDFATKTPGHEGSLSFFFVQLCVFASWWQEKEFVTKTPGHEGSLSFFFVLLCVFEPWWQEKNHLF